MNCTLHQQNIGTVKSMEIANTSKSRLSKQDTVNEINHYDEIRDDGLRDHQRQMTAHFHANNSSRNEETYEEIDQCDHSVVIIAKGYRNEVDELTPNRCSSDTGGNNKITTSSAALMAVQQTLDKIYR